MLETPQLVRTGANSFAAKFGDDNNVHVEFSMEAVLDQFQSDETGIPTYHDVEMVTIWTPGKRDTFKDKVSPAYIKRFQRQYDDFKAGLEPTHDGLPLTEWPVISKAQALNLRNSKIFTVEQLASIIDQNLGSLGMGGRDLRDKAKAYLSRATDSKEITQLFARMAKLEADSTAKDEQISQLRAALNEPKTETLKLKRG